MNFSAAIFDLDGTLIDSNSVWKKIDIILLERRGIRYTEETVNRMAAMTYEDAAAAMRELGVTSTEEEIVRECGELAVNEYRHNIFLKEYAAEYLTYLKGQGIKIALATASPRELYEPVLRNNHVYGFFDAFCTTGEAGRDKNCPDVYLLAASKLGVSPNECVVFEDVLKGVVSAKNAGMTAVGVYDRYSEEDIITIRAAADRFIMNFSEMMK
ncbi:MAG: HAD family phosphatase [Ruminococcus sp.]|nr:HAD family phosphatase [Ruminococcus sp.]MCM1381706.1 HAD family phosphatase [Muribaculaceae bacterium]